MRNRWVVFESNSHLSNPQCKSTGFNNTNTGDQFNKTFKPQAIGHNFVGPTTSNIVGCYMLRPFAHPVAACCCMLLCVVGSCCAKFETSQIFEPTTPNISFVPWSPKRSTTMLDPFAQLFLCATRGHYTWSPKCYGLYPSHDALQVPTLLVWFE